MTTRLQVLLEDDAVAEVLQAILQRYVTINRREAIRPAFDALLRVVDEVYAVDVADIQRAKTLVQGVTLLAARDAMHVAIMQRLSTARILSFDTGFDHVNGIERVTG